MMQLAKALGVGSAEEVDPTRPLSLGRFELGTEASAEAHRILTGEHQPPELRWRTRAFETPLYWSVAHQTDGAGELFSIPSDYSGVLPTALEIALVRAIAAAPEADQAKILEGDVIVELGSPSVTKRFGELVEVVRRPLAGESILFGSCTQATIQTDVDTKLTETCLTCFGNSMRTSPLKFRFLELYRMIEARFIADVKARLLTRFDAQPGDALQEAVDALKSEMNQIRGLAENQKDAFEACWTVVDTMRSTNRFAAALFRKAQQNGLKGAKWETGAALIYQIRCAIVHAGQKDLIYEGFLDGDEVIEALLPAVERTALILVGIEVA
ncbi:hypothetical protein [Sphingosinicella sp. BN140058]|uniref:hypothetical protein n=1 Tax=Sphingosinicella sp. BN140058 TaxID=1892855 RepID=UPI00101031AB|nr:hypothetical protein [Sphingosinicella sp. BN140058]QAY77573.1 hypothetical protein ETR14_14440 [Sphingosinicella sp. BN140058]